MTTWQLDNLTTWQFDTFEHRNENKSCSACLKDQTWQLENFKNFENLKTFLQVDRLEDELVQEQEKFKAITEELDQTFAEMSGY